MDDAEIQSVREKLSHGLRQLGARYPDDPVVQDTTADLETALEELGAVTAQLAQHTEDLARHEVELQQERQRWQTLFDVAPGSMVVSDSAGVIVELNRRARDLLGIEGEPSRPILLALRFAPEARPAFQRMLRDPSTYGDQPLKVRLARPEAAEFRGELRCAVVGAGRLLWLLQDVSAGQLARELLESANARERAASEQLRAVDAMRRAFLLGVSHDLRAPVAAIAGLASLLRTQNLGDAERDRVVGQLEESARETVAMLGDLLDYERIEDARMPVQRRRCDVAASMKRAIDQVDGARHRLVAELPATTAHVDPTIVERIATNLVRNAVQHTPEGTTIWIRCGREPDGVLVVVEDDGPGIPLEARSTVFDLFQRGDFRRATGGLGVGLALVRRFAKMHEGYARVEERPGGGASFHVLLAE